jgi:peptidoglycan glycosyltransferase
MALVYAGIANDGVVMTPYLLQSVLDSEGAPVRSTKRRCWPRQCLEFGARRDPRRANCCHGVRDRQGRVQGFRVTVAGKTGTAR